jgi:hypothetical protein
MERSEHLWARRLRWRLRGAWQWPAYAVLTVLDALILHALPPAQTEPGFAAGLIVASFANLFLMGAVAPWLARRLAGSERARGENGVPLAVRTEILKDRAAAILLGLATLGLVAVGLVSYPLNVNETEKLERNRELFTDYLLREAPHEIIRNKDTANTIRLEEGYFRTCVNYDDRSRVWCVFIDVDTKPPRITKDPSTLPNQEFKPR